MWGRFQPRGGDRISSSRTWAGVFSSMSSRSPAGSMADSNLRRDSLMVWRVRPAFRTGRSTRHVVGSVSRARNSVRAKQLAGSVMTATKSADAIGGDFMGPACRFITLILRVPRVDPGPWLYDRRLRRRWVDVFWTRRAKAPQSRSGEDPAFVFGVLVGYSAFGLTMLILVRTP